jgi:molybdopterin synthase catalytic subunit
VRVRVRLFAGLRERAGWSEREVEAATVADVWGELGLGEEPAGLLYAVNQEYAERSTPLADGDEVAVIPPVSGGAFRLVDGPIDLAAVVAEVEDERAGAIATFQGAVRRRSRGRDVIALEYEAYSGMAEKVMAEIADGVRSATTSAPWRSRIAPGAARSARCPSRSRSPPRTGRMRSRPAATSSTS